MAARMPPNKPATQRLGAAASTSCDDPDTTGQYRCYAPARYATAGHGSPQKKLAATAQERETRARNGPPFGHSLDALLSESEKSLL